MSLKPVSCAGLVATFISCGQLSTPPEPPFLTQDSAEGLLNPSTVRELEVEHSATLGPRPSYRVRISEDGNYEYEGKEFVLQIGRKAGSTYPTEFSPLFFWLRDHPAQYAASGDRTHGADLEAVTFRFTLKSGKTVVVEYSLGFQGDDLWALSSIVDGLIARALIHDRRDGPHERKPAT